MTTVTPMRRRKDLRIEGQVLPTTLADLADLRRAILNAGYPEQVANGITGWVLGKAQGETDGMTGDTRARYRKVLEDVLDNVALGGNLETPIIIVLLS